VQAEAGEAVAEGGHGDPLRRWGWSALRRAGATGQRAGDAPRCLPAHRWNTNSDTRQSRAIRSVTEPSHKRAKPVRLWVPTMTRS
jgi:hypothetical protein